jgi:hypothetical protein
MRHFERMHRWPASFIVTGDDCSFNPSMPTASFQRYELGAALEVLYFTIPLMSHNRRYDDIVRKETITKETKAVIEAIHKFWLDNPDEEKSSRSTVSGLHLCERANMIAIYVVSTIFQKGK